MTQTRNPRLPAAVWPATITSAVLAAQRWDYWLFSPLSAFIAVSFLYLA